VKDLSGLFKIISLQYMKMNFLIVKKYTSSSKTYSYKLFLLNNMYLIRRRWVDNIKMDLREIRWDGVDLIDMAQDRDQWRALVNTVLNFRVP
jgi:hypothetical protein